METLFSNAAQVLLIIIIAIFDFRANTHLFELRNGIEIKGHALEHEMDICILTTDRALGYATYPMYSALKLAIECKFYSNANSLKGEARKFLGAISDLSSNAQPGSTGLNAGCIHMGIDFFRSFATNVSSSLRPDIQHYLNTYTLYPKFGVLPGSAEERTLKNEIVSYSTSI